MNHLELTDDELSALVEACNVANKHKPRPPWCWAGRSAWDKLIAEEMRRGKAVREKRTRP